jgi:hypothetical protein
MNILLWILQSALAFLYLSGGAYKTLKPEDLTTQIAAIPTGGWRALGVLELTGAILLIVPAAIGWKPFLTTLAAAVLAVETLSLAALFGTYSLKIAVTNPLVWAAVMGVLVSLVALGRYALAPLA